MADLTEEEKKIVFGVMEWAKRMGEKHGTIVIDTNGRKYDWGQALCREQFGLDWNNHMALNNIAMPYQDDFDRAIDWELGTEPDWVLEYRNN